MIAAVFYIIGIFALVGFLVRYVGKVNWRARVEGTHLVLTILMMLLNAGLAVAVILFGPFPGVQVVRLVAALAFAVVAIGMLVGLIRVQRHGRRRDAGLARSGASETADPPGTGPATPGEPRPGQRRRP